MIRLPKNDLIVSPIASAKGDKYLVHVGVSPEAFIPRSFSEGEWRRGTIPKINMFYVYLIQSESYPDRRYIGCTQDIKERLQRHNAGRSSHTAKYIPWKLVTYLAFSDKCKAQEFERYLKSGSGQAFANKRFW